MHYEYDRSLNPQSIAITAISTHEFNFSRMECPNAKGIVDILKKAHRMTRAREASAMVRSFNQGPPVANLGYP